MSCSLCNATAELAYSIQHRECGHYTHSDCFPPGQTPNFKLCANCDPATAPATAIGAAPGRGRKVTEPHTHDGIEYWRNPGKRNESGAGSSSSLLAGVKARVLGTPVGGGASGSAKEPPFQLLKRHVPVAQIMAQHGYGLDHILRDGLDIEDFLTGGYDWDDLCAFKYIADMGPIRCLETLTNGLGLTANHLRDNPDRLPVAAFMAATQMPTSDWQRRLGLRFDDNGPMHCYGDRNWNAMHCVALGLTMDDLMDFGLWRLEQYEDLLKNLTRSERVKAERDLRVTPAQVEELRQATAAQQQLLQQANVGDDYVDDDDDQDDQDDYNQQQQQQPEEVDDERVGEEYDDAPPPAKQKQQPPSRRAAPAAAVEPARRRPQRQQPQQAETVMEARLRERFKRDGYRGGGRVK